ncbi:Acetylxylan esterase precursor [Rubripirellula tenax]|uniref:Acetylxylan esterase n=1 Tax=Rubripirellula tenax TaxID=2528015 RepID=A0A5C6ET74_9BACT|nr:alpha/beta hydrolase [Rubripirellula tenax]TWU50806.1 Acetylxylan esterase precursor [Rubripirellula tenax]
MTFKLTITTLFLSSMAWMGASAVEPVTLKLWENGAPGVTADKEGDAPNLIVTRIDSETPTAGIVILPGGGYGGHAMDHEGHQIADWFKSMGVASAICDYRLRGKGNAGKGYGHPVPMQDAQRAIQTMRAGAKRWNIDPDRIGVIGFSAGGHLCSTVSTQFHEADPDAVDPIDRFSSLPNFSILCYPVITMDPSFTHAGSRRNLLGQDPDPQLALSLSNETRVTPQTPPTFLFHTIEDKAVPVANSLRYFDACIERGVAAELHVFPAGRHGLGLAADTPGASQWPRLCENWLRGLGIVTQP